MQRRHPPPQRLNVQPFEEPVAPRPPGPATPYSASHPHAHPSPFVLDGPSPGYGPADRPPHRYSSGQPPPPPPPQAGTSLRRLSQYMISPDPRHGPPSPGPPLHRGPPPRPSENPTLAPLRSHYGPPSSAETQAAPALSMHRRQPPPQPLDMPSSVPTGEPPSSSAYALPSAPYSAGHPSSHSAASSFAFGSPAGMAVEPSTPDRRVRRLSHYIMSPDARPRYPSASSSTLSPYPPHPHPTPTRTRRESAYHIPSPLAGVGPPPGPIYLGRRESSYHPSPTSHLASGPAYVRHRPPLPASPHGPVSPHPRMHPYRGHPYPHPSSPRGPAPPFFARRTSSVAAEGRPILPVPHGVPGEVTGTFMAYLDPHQDLTLDLVGHLVGRAEKMGRFDQLANVLDTVFRDRTRLGKSFRQTNPQWASECPVDLTQVAAAFGLLTARCPRLVTQAIGRALQVMVQSLYTVGELGKPDAAALLIAFLFPAVGNALLLPTLLPELCRIYLHLSDSSRTLLTQYFIARQFPSPKTVPTRPPLPLPLPTSSSSIAVAAATHPMDLDSPSRPAPVPDTTDRVPGSRAGSVTTISTATEHPLATYSLSGPTDFPHRASQEPMDPQAERDSRARTLRTVVIHFQTYISERLRYIQKEKAESSGATERERLTPNTDQYVISATKCLAVLYDLNNRTQLLPFTDFYNETVNECLDIKDDYPKFKDKVGFSFCNYPFILNPAMKSDILKIESVINMRRELQDTFFRALFVGVTSPYLVLEIRREHIVRDALCQLADKSTTDLQKQLKVRFVGEEAIDEGGVQKEFFQLIVREIFDAAYGMFEFNEESRLCWFTPQLSATQTAPEPSVSDGAEPRVDQDTTTEYRLLGVLLGLAIYNSVILDVHFPPAMYKKLLGQAVGLDDLAAFDPTLARGLRQLLDYPGDDVEDVFDRTFQVSYSIHGHACQHELVPGGATQPLTRANRQDFVDRYVAFLLQDAVAPAFEAFRTGFASVCSPSASAIRLFRPEEVEQLICGSADLDFAALERVTVYDGGFHAKSKVIRYFWEVVHALSDEQKKRLLFFATGSDRVPIGGLGKLQFVVAKNGVDPDRLPTSHTCFNVLLLSEYHTKGQLCERLLTAIGNAEGFGLI